MFAKFESDVISDGTQTRIEGSLKEAAFESDVISDGTQTGKDEIIKLPWFESDVIFDGTQTNFCCASTASCLRVM